MTPLNIYIAARYSRRHELCAYRDQIEAIRGINGDAVYAVYAVVSRWLDGHHEMNDGDTTVYDDQATRDQMRAGERMRFAIEDYSDVIKADILIAFTEEPRTTKTRGGRHVEFGLALGRGTTTYVVGPRENVFYELPSVIHFNTWEECLARLIGNYDDL